MSDRIRMDLRLCNDLIHSLVAEADEKSIKWEWSVESIERTKVRIFWSYFEYCGQPKPCFVVELEDTGNGCWIHAKDENGETIESEIVTDNDLPFLNCPLDKAVEKMIRCIVSAAHNCY